MAHGSIQIWHKPCHLVLEQGRSGGCRTSTGFGQSSHEILAQIGFALLTLIMRKALLLWWFASSVLAFAQQPKDLFDELEPLSLTLKTDLVKLWGDRSVNAPELQAWISYKDEKEKETFEAKVHVGGNFRRNPANCTYPPLRIDARATTVTGTMFSRQGTLKLVTLCSEEMYIFKEYLAYRLYNHLTDSSFRARLCKVTFIDSNKQRPPETLWGFLIEGPKHLGRRIGMTHSKTERGPDEAVLIQKQWIRLCMFQYMIGNTDWDLKLMKNIHLYEHGGKGLIVPFDYDFSAWVGATYTGLEGDASFDRQIFVAKCPDKTLLAEVIGEFQAKETALRAEIASCKYLPAVEKKKLAGMLDAFFGELTLATSPQSPFLNKCP